MSILTKAAPLTMLAIMLAAASGAGAQAADPQGCTPQERSGETLGQKLSQSNGVICPPDVDPAMKAPAPKSNDPSVIAPPGTPGGDPNVQPK
jgi:hypothetical protein